MMFTDEDQAQKIISNIGIAVFRTTNSLYSTELIAGEEQINEGDKVVASIEAYKIKEPGCLGDLVLSQDNIEFHQGTSPIKGWDLGLYGVTSGSKRILVVPPNLGTGFIHPFNTIPSNASLVHVVTIRKVGNAPVVQNKMPVQQQQPNLVKETVQNEQAHTPAYQQNTNQNGYNQNGQQGYQNQNNGQQGYQNNQGYQNQQQGYQNNQGYTNQYNNQNGYQMDNGYMNQSNQLTMYQPNMQQRYMQPPVTFVQTPPPSNQYQAPPPQPAPTTSSNSNEDTIELLVQEKVFKQSINNNLETLQAKIENVADKISTLPKYEEDDSLIGGVSGKVLLQTITNIVTENQQLTLDIEAKDKRIDRLTDQVNDLIRKNQYFIDENNQYAQERDISRQSKFDEMQRQIDFLQDEKENLQIEASDAIALQNKAVRRFEELKTKYKRLADEYKSIKEQYIKTQEWRKEKQAEADEAREKFLKAKDKYREIEREMVIIRQEAEQYRRDISVLEDRNSALLNQLSEKSEIYEKENQSKEEFWKQEKISLENRINLLKQENQDLKLNEQTRAAQIEEQLLLQFKLDNEKMLNKMKEQFTNKLKLAKEEWESQKNHEIEILKQNFTLQEIPVQTPDYSEYENKISILQEKLEAKEQELQQERQQKKDYVQEGPKEVDIDIEEILKSIINSAFQTLRPVFKSNQEYSGKSVLAAVGKVFVQKTKEASQDFQYKKPEPVGPPEPVNKPARTPEPVKVTEPVVETLQPAPVEDIPQPEVVVVEKQPEPAPEESSSDEVEPEVKNAPEPEVVEALSSSSSEDIATPPQKVNPLTAPTNPLLDPESSLSDLEDHDINSKEEDDENLAAETSPVEAVKTGLMTSSSESSDLVTDQPAEDPVKQPEAEEPKSLSKGLGFSTSSSSDSFMSIKKDTTTTPNKPTTTESPQAKKHSVIFSTGSSDSDDLFGDTIFENEQLTQFKIHHIFVLM
eukprot:TRINITY_DN3146_c0_g1_i1.p1 TRINITY_DN3146_c0_g1~~TRINITY_DN3146_c0_g1_i1.p1  ORF type:complete len:1134 (-),score=326.95 TRINITY_DN3146_c0_g1_i1:684-3593(-)